MRRGLVVGNWKMHGSRSVITDLVGGIKTGLIDCTAEVAVCPPSIYISQVAEALAGTAVGWGGQNLCDQPEGAFTGEVSASMLADFGCQFVIVGHSERRTLYGETDQLVAEKFKAAQACDIRPILCVGESLAQREAGQTLDLVRQQLEMVIASAGVESFSSAVIAYEPIWAIGTGKTATPEQADQVHEHIRSVLAEYSQEIAQQIRILYGGSVKPGNAEELFARQHIDGALVGGASLKAADFVAIATAA